MKAEVADSLKITIGAKDFRIRLGSMGPPMQALDQCVGRMIQRWGYDPVEQASLSEPPRPANNIGNWVTTYDYPGEALWKRMEGMVGFRLDIDTEGRVTGCHIQSSSAPPILEVATCDLVRSRARFRAARDAGGKPVKAYYINRVRWTPPL